MVSNICTSHLQVIKCIQPPESYRLERPRHCPVAIYKVMLACWEEDPVKRPTFDVLEDLVKVVGVDRDRSNDCSLLVLIVS